ncbi:MAG: hypothetical protein P1U88_20505 [Thalassobaculaceae bacterium]|nr:hypothetical protein [Thalassobaculaceae bacterium]
MRAHRTLVAAAVVAGLALPARADEMPSWAPVASEQLIRLPAGYLEKAIERDFRDSSLAGALRDKTDAIAGTAASLADLQAAVESARGPARDELRHQFLVAKQDYVGLMGARQDLERRRVTTRLRLYKQLLARIERTGESGGDPALVALAEQRMAAMRRFAGAADTVDMKLFASATTEESRYGREYRRHAAAIEDLVRAIDAHPMNTAPEIDGRMVGKPEYLAHLVAEAETEMALLDQKDLVLAYMAKLVALDAMALADEVDGRTAEATGRADGGAEVRDVTAAVDFFTAPN